MIIVSIFILCSLTYQPIVANDTLDSIIDKKTVSFREHIEKMNFKEISYLFLRNTREEKDCDCENESIEFRLWPYPIICASIFVFLFILWFLQFVVVGEGPVGGGKLLSYIA